MMAATNLGALFAADRDGAAPALIDCRDWHRPGRYSHGEIERLADACARGLVARGLRRGDTVGLLSANRAEYLIAYLAILRAGLIAVPISYKFPAEIVGFIFRDAALAHLFCDRPRRAALSTDLAITEFDLPGPGGFDDLLDPGEFDAVHPGADEVAMVLYTSGSTGRPKGVPLTHRGHLWALAGRIPPGVDFTHHCLLIAAPLYHMNALCTALFSLATGASTVLLPEFDPRRYLESIARFGCTWITSVPTMLAMALLQEDLLAETDLSSVEIVRMGSAPVSPKLWQRVKQTFVGATINNGYGTTEAGPIVFGAAGGRAVPDLSVGFQLPDVDLKLIDEAGREADQGVLWHRTPATMRGYLNLPEMTREVLTDDGWYISGDVFRRDGDGAYFFVGRSDDMFVCGGENIYPGEVEGLLLGHPDIEQCCVVPVPDEIKGEKPVAFVVAGNGRTVTEDAVKQFALANAPAYQHPRMVVFMDALPLAGPGKVDRNRLRSAAVTRWREVSEPAAISKSTAQAHNGSDR